jgi:hypothetical protein
MAPRNGNIDRDSASNRAVNGLGWWKEVFLDIEVDEVGAVQ